jgi:hypothetical protein
MACNCHKPGALLCPAPSERLEGGYRGYPFRGFVVLPYPGEPVDPAGYHHSFRAGHFLRNILHLPESGDEIPSFK